MMILSRVIRSDAPILFGQLMVQLDESLVTRTMERLGVDRGEAEECVKQEVSDRVHKTLSDFGIAIET